MYYVVKKKVGVAKPHLAPSNSVRLCGSNEVTYTWANASQQNTYIYVLPKKLLMRICMLNFQDFKAKFFQIFLFHNAAHN